jgi:transposase
MIGLAMYTTIITLHKQGQSQRKITKLVQVDRKTVRKIIKKYESAGIEEPKPCIRGSQLSVWHGDIVEFLEKGLSYVRILEELHNLGYSGCYSSMRRYIISHHLKVETCIRFHTPAGEEAQVDFGDVGRRYDSRGKLRKAYIFNMRLSHSRLDYYEVVFDQKVATWLKCHINAFEFFGGVPEYVKLDNLKAGILKADYYEATYQREYKRLADHYGFNITPCRVAKPQEKGKVESGIKYVKNNFFAGREFTDYADMTKKLEYWLDRVNTRIHGTTKKVPKSLFEEEEQDKLITLPKTSFDMSSWHIRKVAKDCHITLENNYYSVPSKYVGKEVGISLSPELLHIHFEEERISTHARSKGAGIFTTIASHYAKGKRQCPGFKEYDEKLESRMEKIGPYGMEMLQCLKIEYKNHWHKAVRGILSLKKTYSDEDINKALERGICYGVKTYVKIKGILTNNCHKLPLPEDPSNMEYTDKKSANLFPKNVKLGCKIDSTTSVTKALREVSYARIA